MFIDTEQYDKSMASMNMKVCLGWCCPAEYRHTCSLAMREGTALHVRWFLPVEKGEHCNYYQRIEHGTA